MSKRKVPKYAAPSTNPCPVCGGTNWVGCYYDSKDNMITPEGCDFSQYLGTAIVDVCYLKSGHAVDFCIQCDTGFTEK